MFTTAPNANISKLSPAQKVARNVRMICWSSLRNEKGYTTQRGNAATMISFLLGALTLSAALVAMKTPSTHSLGIAGLLGLIPAVAIAIYLFCARPGNLPLSEDEYAKVDKILAQNATWAPIVAAWVVANAGHLDGRHLRAIMRAQARTLRWAAMTKSLQDTPSGYARNLLNGKLAGHIDQLLLAQATPEAPSTTSPVQRL